MTEDKINEKARPYQVTITRTNGDVIWQGLRSARWSSTALKDALYYFPNAPGVLMNGNFTAEVLECDPGTLAPIEETP